MRHASCTKFLSVLILGGCAAVTPPDAYRQLSATIHSVSIDDERYEAARGHLADANAAMDKKDQEALDRHSYLGLTEAHIARTRVLQSEMVDLLQKERDRKTALALEVAALESQVGEQLQLQARSELRTQIEAVIQKSTLEAAAQEEIQSHTGDATEAQLSSARQKVGRQLLAMARVRQNAAQMYVARERLIPEQLQPLNGHVAALEKAVNNEDAAGAWEHAEKSMEQFRRCTDDAWMVSEKSYEDAKTRLAMQLREKNFPITAEEIGVAVPFDLRIEAQRKEFTASTIDLLNAAIIFLNEHDNVYMQVWISGTSHSSQIAHKQATTLEVMIRDAFDSLGAPDKRVSVFSLTNERPLRTLTGEYPQGTLLFMPLP